MKYQPEQTPKQCRQVNTFIKENLGIDVDLVKGNGYFYFAGLIPFESSVYVNNIWQMTFSQWLSEYESLKRESG